MTRLYDVSFVGESIERTLDFITHILQASTDHTIFATDLEDKIILWNEGSCKVYGYESDEIVSNLSSDILYTKEDLANGLINKIRQIAIDNGRWVGNIKNVKKSGECFMSHTVLTPLKDQKSKIFGYLNISRDISDDLKLVEKLKQAEFYNRNLIESQIDALLTTDLLGNITDANKQAEVYTTFKKENLIGSKFNQYFTEPSKVDEVIKLTLQQKRLINVSLKLKSDNNKFDVELNSTLFHDINGLLQGIFFSLRDMSSQIELETKLIESERYNRGLIEASADAQFVISEQGMITDVNDAAVDLTTYSRKDLINSSFSNYFKDPARAQEGLNLTFEKKRLLDYELIIINNQKQEIIVSLNAAVFMDRFGKPLGILASARNIMQQKTLEMQLRENQFYTRSLIEANIDALITTNLIGVITDVNKQMTIISDYTPEELIGSLFKNYFTDPLRAEDGLKEVLRNGKVINYELTMKAKNGKLIEVSYNATIFRDSNGILQGVFASARDITSRKLSEQKLKNTLYQLEAMNNELQLFEHIAAHDLQEPLRIISSFSELLSNRYQDKLDENAHEFIQYIVNGSKRAQSLINDLMTYLSILSYKEPAKLCDLNKIVNQVLTDLKSMIQQKDAEIHVAKLPTIYAESTHISLVFNNLLNNAIKFCEHHNKIYLDVKEEKDFWLFSIRDNGIGIDPKYFKLIFKMFQRLNKKEQYPGNGLGLPLCQKIVEHHGGKIWVTSALGKGSTFFFTIPKILPKESEDEKKQ